MMTTRSDTFNQRSNVTCARVARWVKGGNIASARALSHSSFEAVKALDDMRLCLEQDQRVPLRAKQLFSADSIEKNVKQFCGELLDRCVPNHWKTTIRQHHVAFAERASIASSLFSVRKLVTSAKPNPLDYVYKMTRPQERPPMDFLLFCAVECRKIFQSGWDRGYWDQVNGFTPPNKSNVRTKENGTYRAQAVVDDSSRGRFRRWAGGTVVTPLDRGVRAKAVLTGGKWRVITLSDPAVTHLLPLHRTIYNRLSKEKWLLRGEAQPSEFQEFLRVDGERIVSGDYEGATDNLNIHVSEHVLRCLLSTATHIPTRVREEAMSSLRMQFLFEDDSYLEQSRGQLMGNPLSFPLLCLINFLSFKYAVRREVPVKINGDDIVFRASQDEIDRWFSFVSCSGLIVSPGKTMVNSRLFSLNSSYFLASVTGVTRVQHLRASALFKKCEDMTSLTGRVAQIRRDLTVGETRNMAMRILLRKNFQVIYPSQGSFSRRYSCPLPGAVLRSLRILERESFYSNLIEEPLALKPYCKVRQDTIPKTWTKERVLFSGDRKIEDREVGETFVSAAWTSPLISETKDEYWRRVKDGSFPYFPFSKKTFDLFRKVSRFFYGKRQAFRPAPVPLFSLGKKFWVEKECNEGAQTAPVAFRSAGVLIG